MSPPKSIIREEGRHAGYEVHHLKKVDLFPSLLLYLSSRLSSLSRKNVITRLYFLVILCPSGVVRFLGVLCKGIFVRVSPRSCDSAGPISPFFSRRTAHVAPSDTHVTPPAVGPPSASAHEHAASPDTL